MSAAPQSVLMTPDRRRRLQQQYDAARQLGNQPQPDFRRIHDLLAACLRADPGNVLYLDALLANLKRRDATGQRPGRLWTWLTGWLRPRPPVADYEEVLFYQENSQARYGEVVNPHPAAAPPPSPKGRGISLGPCGDRAEGLNLAASTQYSALSTQYAVLHNAADNLWKEPNSLSLFHQFAVAASECDCDEAELRYLAAARDLAPDDPATLRMVARALTRIGRFEDALGPWCAVLALVPGDAEAEQATNDLRAVAVVEPITPTADNDQAARGDAQLLLLRARASESAGEFAAAEHYFAKAQAALGGDLTLLEERERSRLLRSEQRMQIARQRAEHDQHAKAKSLVARLEGEHNRLEIDLLNLRAERHPANWQVRLELARRLKQAGNFSGAIQRLEEALRLAPGEAAVLVELGESWQHLRQFAKALCHYQQAVAAVEAATPLSAEIVLLSRYRTAVLAAAMDQAELARGQFASIVAIQPEYKDARRRLAALSPAQAE